MMARLRCLRCLRCFYRGFTPTRTIKTGRSFLGRHVISRVGGVRYLVGNTANTANTAPVRAWLTLAE
jgi:hypothetical protein